MLQALWKDEYYKTFFTKEQVRPVVEIKRYAEQVIDRRRPFTRNSRIRGNLYKGRHEKVYRDTLSHAYHETPNNRTLLDS